MYCFSLAAIVDCISTLPGFLVWVLPFTQDQADTPERIILSILLAFSILRTYRVAFFFEGMEKAIFLEKIDVFLIGVSEELARLIYLILSLILFGSAVFETVEDLLFHEALYFTIITFTTVGYGDIAPQTTYARMTVIVMLSIAVVLIPYQSSKLVKLVNQYSGL